VRQAAPPRVPSPTGTITTVAGTGDPGGGGDGGPATEARLDYPCGVAIDGDGNVFIADRGNGSVRKVDRNGTISTVADGLDRPVDVVIGPENTLYVAEYKQEPSGARRRRGHGHADRRHRRVLR
jgi:hypothetical protein